MAILTYDRHNTAEVAVDWLSRSPRCAVRRDWMHDRIVGSRSNARVGAILSPLPAALPLLKITRLESATSSSAEVAEWQTQRTQNPPCASMCGFKSRPRHQQFPSNGRGARRHEFAVLTQTDFEFSR